MGHQHHFLSRLDRISMPQVELALALYRDHERVHFLLRHLSLPEDAERVAISLDHPVQGPFLIVTREGRFVTCLGQGMKPGRLPIVTRERLDGIAAKHSDLRARMEACRTLTGREGGAGKLMLRLYHAGDDLSREEVIAASALVPLLRGEFIQMLARVLPDLDTAREQILDVLRRTNKPRTSWRDVLEHYWKTFWCSVHLTVVIAVDGRELFEQVSEGARGRMRTCVTGGLFEHALISPAAKAIWSISKLGRSFLPNYKDAYAKTRTAMQMLESLLSLAALGLRHAHIRAEVRKTIEALPPQFGRDPSQGGIHKFAEGLVKLCSYAFDDPEGMRQGQRSMGARIAIVLGEDHPPGHVYRFEREEDVPDEIAFALTVNQNVNFLADITKVAPLFCALPWIARAKVEDLYLPRPFLASVYEPWTPEHTLDMFRDIASHRKKLARLPRQGPTRNGPCPCGSGKKHKRCCAKEA